MRHRLVPPPLPSATPSTSGRPDYAPRSDRAAECLSFIDGGASGKPLVLAASYADGHIRLWNVQEGRVVLDFHGDHKLGESILTIATNAGGTRVLTGDSVGRLRLWDISKVGRCRFTPV